MHTLAARRQFSLKTVLAWTGLLLIVLLTSTQKVSAATVTLEPTRDTYVDSGAPNSSYGNIGLGVVKDQPSDGSSSLILMHFDVSSIPAGSTISSAILSIKLGGCINSDPSAGRITLGGYQANGSPAWTESSTWAQLSTSGSSIDGFFSQDISCSAGSRFDLDFLPIVSYWVDGTSPNDGLLINRVNGGGYWTRVFYMSEAAAGSRPTLTVSYEPPYESVTTPDGPPESSDGASSTPSTTKKPESGSNTVVAESSPEPLAPDTSIVTPAKLTAKQVTNSSHVSLSWQASKTSDISVYRIYRKIAGQTTYTKIAEVDKSKLSYTDTKTSLSKQHSYFVRAVRNSKESLNSPVVSITVQPQSKSTTLVKKQEDSRLPWILAAILALLLLASLVAYKLLHKKHKKLHAAHSKAKADAEPKTDG